MRPSGIGGQAVLEGIMMRNRDRYAVAVRKSDGTIAVDFHMDKVPKWQQTVKKIPIVRGVVSFVSSLVVGMQTLTYSASFFEEEEETEKEREKREKKEKKKAEKKAAAGKEAPEKEKKADGSEKGEAFTPLEMGLTVALAIVLAIGIFMLLPYGLSLLVGRFVKNVTLLALIEGVFRLVIFLAYVWAITFMDDIKRTYMYHGSEHKCINCIEHGLPLTVENVRKSSRFHKRCGTSFLLVVMVISIVVFSFIRVNSPILRLVYRLLLIPVVAGVSYEFLQWAGRSENAFVNLLSKPGLYLQRLTTKEPTDDMIEVAIAAVERVFDWEAFLEGKDAAECFPKKKPSYRKLTAQAAAQLKEAGVEDAAHDARALMLYASKMTLTEYLAVQSRPVNDRALTAEYAALVDQRAARVPLQHLTGTQGFYGLEFAVNETVLIPRPETEILVEEALKVCPAGDDAADEPFDVLDLCTGSGCILIAMLHENPSIRGTGTDFSEDALASAAENAKRLGVTAQWVCSDLFASVEGTFDLIVSNPPYVRTGEIDELQPEVRDHDPRMALDGGADGLDFYRRIAAESPQHLKDGGHLMLEIGADQAEEVTALLSEAGFGEIALRQDLSGLDRVLIAGVGALKNTGETHV